MFPVIVFFSRFNSGFMVKSWELFGASLFSLVGKCKDARCEAFEALMMRLTSIYASGTKDARKAADKETFEKCLRLRRINRRNILNILRIEI